MKKVILATAVLALMSTSSFAAMKSHGTATTTMTLKAPAEWSITATNAGVATLKPGNILDDASQWSSEATFTVHNGTSAEGSYSIKGAGASAADGQILAVSQTDPKKTFSIGTENMKWDATNKMYISKSALAANADEATVWLYSSGDLAPGVYNVTLDLLTGTP